MALDPSNSSNLEQLALKGLNNNVSLGGTVELWLNIMQIEGPALKAHLCVMCGPSYTSFSHFSVRSTVCNLLLIYRLVVVLLVVCCIVSVIASE